MSTALAIAAVTQALRGRIAAGLNLDPSLAGAVVTTRPLDEARVDDNDNQVNLYLYHMAPNPAWRMVDSANARPGERGQTPLALKLSYLLTAFHGEDQLLVEEVGGRLMGSTRALGLAMNALHDFPIFDTATINSALPAADQADFPYQQVEHVRITQQPLSLDEMSKIWSSFQAHYRPSVAYEVSVVLIESSQPRRAALPVLRRGAANQGVFVFASTAPGLSGVVIPGSKASAELGDTLTLLGTALPLEGAAYRLTQSNLDVEHDLTPEVGSQSTEVALRLPALADGPTIASDWPAGFYLLAARREQPPAPTLTSNALPFALAPTVVSRAPASTPAGNFTLTITCRPRVRAGQRVALIFGENEVAPASQTTPADPAQPTTLTFDLTAVDAGAYVLRLRVDGVDSIPVDVGAGATTFDPGQVVTVT